MEFDARDPNIKTTPDDSRDVLNGSEFKPSRVASQQRVQIGGDDLRTFYTLVLVWCTFIYSSLRENVHRFSPLPAVKNLKTFDNIFFALLSAIIFLAHPTPICLSPPEHPISPSGKSGWSSMEESDVGSSRELDLSCYDSVDSVVWPHDDSPNNSSGDDTEDDSASKKDSDSYNRPHFIVQVQKRNLIGNNGVRIPMDFAREFLRPKTNMIRTMTLCTEIGSFPVQYRFRRFRGRRVKLGTGWRRFAVGHNLRVHDRLDFQLIDRIKQIYEVDITR